MFCAQVFSGKPCRKNMAVPAVCIVISEKWESLGFFRKLWKKGLAEYDEMEGIAWTWQSIDGTMIKAPTAQESVGPNPTDRGKKWNQTTYSCRRAWGPVVNRRNRS